MKIGNIIYYIALQNIKDWKKRIVFQSLMLCFFLSVSSILILWITVYQEEHWAEGMLDGKMKDYYFVNASFTNEGTDDTSGFAKRLQKAGYRYTSVSGLVQIDFDKNTDLMKIQNELQIKRDVVRNLKRIDKLYGYENVHMDGESLESAIQHIYNNLLMGVIVSQDTFLDFKGILDQEMDLKEQEGVKYLYLGANLRAIPLGSQYTYNDNQYIVKGYLKKGKSVFASDQMTRMMREDLSFHIVLDDLVIVKENMDGWQESMVYYPTKDYASIQKDMQNMSKDLGGNVTLIPLKSIRKEAYAFLIPYSYFIKKLIIAFGITTVLTILTYQLNDMFVEKRKYRIWYETGFSKIDIIKMQFVDYLGQFLFTSFISLLSVNGYLLYYYDQYSSIALADKVADLKLCIGMSSSIVLVLAILLGVMSSLLPALYINQKRPIDFM